ncbi:MAG: hypothetical protein IKT39_03125 [Clostridia bacterium]|nr:hypothetical protein [Clostridia bacterium]
MSGRGKEKGTAGKRIRVLLAFFVPYWILSFIMIFIIFAFVALIFLITPLSQSTFPFISCFVFVAVEIAVSYFMGRFCSMPAIYSGAIFGAGLAIIMLVVGLVTASLSLFSLKFLFMLITGIMIGIFGAIAGYNAKPRKKYGRYTVR